MSKQLVPRLFFLLFLLFLLSIQCVCFSYRASAQTLKNFELSANAFGQFTGSTSGNGIQDVPSRSMGGLVSFRQSFKPWLGYEVNYSYTRFSEAYSHQPFSVQNNLHEATAAYLVQAPKLLFGIQPFAAIGTGSLIFLPTNTGGQHNGMQDRLVLLYEFGANIPLITDHFGARVEYRGLAYKTPDFGDAFLATGTRRQTSEPAVGLYARF